MKRLLLLICILLPFQAYALTPEKKVSKTAVSTVISECRSYDGVEIVRLGRVATSAIKSVIRVAAIGDSDAREALRLMRGIHQVSVLDYEDCSDRDKRHITRKLERALSGSEVLMEASDGDDDMKIYGLFDDDNGTVRDFVLYSPTDCSLICIFGSISLDAVGKIASGH